ncbi:MAG: GHKL domain-containing protein [Cohnella sp.]|nr:GHKL domain-containing protein [Cohnella sp.]
MDTLLDALKLHLLASLPQTFVVSLFVFSFLHPQPNMVMKRLLIFTVVHAVCTDFILLYIPVPFQILNSLLAMLALMFLLFRELSLRKKVFLFFGLTIMSMLMDIVITSIATAMGVEDLDSMRRENLFVFITLLYPALTMTLISAWFVRKRFSLSSFKSLSVNFNHNKTLLKIIALIVIQLVSLGSIYFVKIAADANERLVTTILIYFSIIVSLAALVFMLRMLTQTRADAIRSTQEVYFDDINNMFASVRGQRHDFLNHVQVIHAMAQMGKIDQLQAYTATLVQETREVSDIMNHTVPALAAFAKAKTTMALGYGIAFTCDLPKEWNVPDNAINMLDLIKIIGNLVDNGFDATITMPAGQRSVHISIRTDNDEVKIKIANSGHPIDDEMRTRMFQAGYSTKGEGHSGLGLAIVQDRVSHYRGQLDLRYDADNGMTTFEISLPFTDRLVI